MAGSQKTPIRTFTLQGRLELGYHTSNRKFEEVGSNPTSPTWEQCRCNTATGHSSARFLFRTFTLQGRLDKGYLVNIGSNPIAPSCEISFSGRTLPCQGKSEGSNPSFRSLLGRSCKVTIQHFKV